MRRFPAVCDEPCWLAHRSLGYRRVPLSVLHWLLDPSSLTGRIRSACGAGFSVRVLAQGWARPMINEARLLRMRPQRLALLREVHLLCGGRPWVFARTVIPQATLSGPERRLARLGNRPLGAVLFADPHMRRGEVQVTRLQPGDAVHGHVFADGDGPPVWGRRSLFRLNDKPLLVSEFFLPEMLAAAPEPA